MQVFLFHGHERRRSKLVRELSASSALTLEVCDSGAALIDRLASTRGALVFWDVDTDPHGWHILDDRGVQMVLLGSTKTDRSHVLARPCSRSVILVALPYEAWRIRPLVERFIAVQTGAGIVGTPPAQRRSGPALGRLPSAPEIEAVVLASPSLVPPPLPPEAAAERDPRALRVLVADDDEVLRHILTYEFEEAGWLVTACADGLEAQAQLAAVRFDVILLDLNLPRRNAFELLEQMESDTPPVVVMSEQSQDDKVLRAYELGARDFVRKPIRPRVLLTRITRAVLGISDTACDPRQERLAG